MCVCRALDVTLGTIALLLLGPVMLIVAAAIRVESAGPAIFRQLRVGRDHGLFTVHKFRTMRQEASQDVHRDYVLRLIAGDEEKVSDGRHSLYKLAVDDRITRVGRFLRRTSLDELPQLWDVVCGRMSLVGPRPVIPYEAETYPPHYHARFCVKPGMTGLWQVSGRNERTYDEMVQLDIEFAQGMSVGIYLSILARTVVVVAARRGAA